jgi:hypothetical protein
MNKIILIIGPTATEKDKHKYKDALKEAFSNHI